MADERFVAAMQQWKEFLESTPAYVERRFENLLYDMTPTGPAVMWGSIRPAFSSTAKWTMVSAGLIPVSSVSGAPSTALCSLHTRAETAGEWDKTFAVILDPDLNAKPRLLTAVKLGEYPPFGSHLAKRLQDMLSKTDLELYRKGLRTEREGHGIGAAAYFRRVVDNQWKALVKKLRDAAEKLGTPAEKLKDIRRGPRATAVLDGRGYAERCDSSKATNLGWTKSPYVTLQAAERADS